MNKKLLCDYCKRPITSKKDLELRGETGYRVSLEVVLHKECAKINDEKRSKSLVYKPRTIEELVKKRKMLYFWIGLMIFIAVVALYVWYNYIDSDELMFRIVFLIIIAGMTLFHIAMSISQIKKIKLVEELMK